MDHATTIQEEETVDMLNAMLQQESSHYLTESCIYDQPQNAIDGDCRRSMVQWCMQVADFCQYDKNTLCMAINTLDRFVAMRPSIVQDDNDEYQLAAMACLYTAVKTNENIALDPESMSKLSKGKFGGRLIEDMELNILMTLKWRVNMPTALSFADMFLQLFLSDVAEEQRTLLCQLIQDQIMCAAQEPHFLGISASQLALTAVRNAVKLVTGSIPSSVPVALQMPVQLQEALFNQIQNSAVSTPAIVVQSKEEASSTKVSSATESQQHLSPRCITMSR
mmetsp:Transcript_18414/g.27820  ORF Transcript_18414/g.27820 Transcript_18414/m.27820 type:complete len:279 (-) Transcript_18414:39-875(-)